MLAKLDEEAIDTVYSELKAGPSAHLTAHSQGGLITSRALSDVARRLRVEGKLSRVDTEALMSNIKCETFAAAAGLFPDGPAEADPGVLRGERGGR